MKRDWLRLLVVLLLVASVLGATQATRKGVSALDFGGVTAAALVRQ
jgi:hypothetical protein